MAADTQNRDAAVVARRAANAACAVSGGQAVQRKGWISQGIATEDAAVERLLGGSGKGDEADNGEERGEHGAFGGRL